MKTRTYNQLRAEERVTIAALKLQKKSNRAIARILGRSPATIMRELQRNGCNATYGADQAHARARQRRCNARSRRRKLAPDTPLWGVVCELLSWRWSPEQISHILKGLYPKQARYHVSHETIYNAIYAQPRGELRKGLIAFLRQGKGARKPRTRGADRRGRIPDMTSIHVRPPEVRDRLFPGHWEGDLIKGAGNRSAVGVLHERTSRVTLLCKVRDATTESGVAAFTEKLRSIAEPMRKTLTYDQGKEMTNHAALTAATGVRVYFCDPHSPWQRAGCENINGLIRQYLPKGTDLSVYSQDELDAIADSLNTRPRKVLNWQFPINVYADMLRRATIDQHNLH